MNALEYFLYSIIVIYSLTISLFTIGWFRIKSFKASNSKTDSNVSIVIACRNEENNIAILIENLVNQTFYKEKTEILIVDDHSNDSTINIINEFIKKYEFIKLLNLPDKKYGKKAAITYGVNAATSDIILTTDADCSMGKNWISSMLDYYNQFKPKMLLGPVAFNTENIFEQFQALEFSSLIGSGAGAIGINRAIMNNGANLLFEKSVFLESNLNTNYASGDDIFLMLDIKKKHKNTIQFIKSKNAIVHTKAEKTIGQLFNQRVRWTSKSKAYRDFDILFTAIIVTLTNLSLVCSFAYSFFNHKVFFPFIILFGIKSFFDFGILIPVSNFFKQKKLLWLFIPLQIIYPIYILVTVIFGLAGNFQWKERNFQEKR